jgi:hypothetical protein
MDCGDGAFSGRRAPHAGCSVQPWPIWTDQPGLTSQIRVQALLDSVQSSLIDSAALLGCLGCALRRPCPS